MLNDLVTKSKKSVVAIFSGQVIKVFVQVINLVILARILTPEDYGLTAVAIAVVGLGEVIRDFGLSTASIQADNLSHKEKSNLFWLNSFIGLVLFLILFLASSQVASFYNDRRLEEILRVLSLIFFISGITTQYRAGLSRDLRFKSITFAEVFAAVVSSAVAIIAATLGFGFWAIVIQQICLNLVMLFTYIYFYRWTPSLPDYSVSINHFIKFGAHLMGNQLIGQLTKSIDTFVIGHQFGAEILGLYNRAHQIVFMGLMQINAPATSLAVPVLSKLKNNQTEYGRYLLFGHSVLLHIVTFAFGLLAINAELIVSLALGSQWVSAVSLVRVLCFAAIFHVCAYSHYWVCISKDLNKERLIFTIYTRPLLLLIIVAGAYFGVLAVAISVGLGFFLLWLLSTIFLYRNNIDTREITKITLFICGSNITAMLISLGFYNADYLVGMNKAISSNLIYIGLLTLMFIISSYYRMSVLNVFKMLKISRPS